MSIKGQEQRIRERYTQKYNVVQVIQLQGEWVAYPHTDNTNGCPDYNRPESVYFAALIQPAKDGHCQLVPFLPNGIDSNDSIDDLWRDNRLGGYGYDDGILRVAQVPMERFADSNREIEFEDRAIAMLPLSRQADNPDAND